MSKLDYVTIAIVVICVAALIYLAYSVIKLMGTPTPAPSEQVTEPAIDTSYYDDEETYNYDDEGEVMSDESTQPDTSRYTYDEPVYEDDSVYDDQEETPESETPAGYSGEGDYLVLAGSYRYQHNAETEVRRLQSLGYSRAEAALFNRGAYAAVLVDRFTTLSEAQELARELRSRHGVEAYVHEKRRNQ